MPLHLAYENVRNIDLKFQPYDNDIVRESPANS